MREAPLSLPLSVSKHVPNVIMEAERCAAGCNLVERSGLSSVEFSRCPLICARDTPGAMLL